MEDELIERRQQNSLLLEQVKQIPVLQEIITQLSEQVKRLQEQIAKDRHNSSLSPSSDRFSVVTLDRGGRIPVRRTDYDISTTHSKMPQSRM